MQANPSRRAGAAYEFFLYAAILAETALAALVYKVIFQSGELVHLRVYFTILYFGFLAWAIAQLQKLHRARKMAVDDPPSGEPAVHTRRVLGLTSPQFVVVLVVFATAVAAFSWALRALD
jgi:hypothetical protein